jgi:hypothetical protein
VRKCFTPVPPRKKEIYAVFDARSKTHSLATNPKPNDGQPAAAGHSRARSKQRALGQTAAAADLNVELRPGGARERSGFYRRVETGGMKHRETIIEKAYSAFNERDIDAALALMAQDVRWPKASEGGTVIGKEEIRAYWTRQWAEFDPHVEPLAMTEEDGGKIRVRVHQLVKGLEGDVLSDSQVFHVFTMSGDRIAAMELGDEAAPTGFTSSLPPRRAVRRNFP